MFERKTYIWGIDMTDKWTKETCLANALQYKTRSEWHKKSASAYERARRNGWLDECTSHMPKVKEWTKEMCLADAAQYKTRSEWYRNSTVAYEKARRERWLELCCAHMLPSPKNCEQMRHERKWTKEKCMIDAQPYKTRTEWSNNSQSAYKAARENQWLNECCSHMPMPKITKKWSKENCLADALQYKTRADWQRNSPNGYNAAIRHYWLDECTAHMPKVIIKWTKEKCTEDAQAYDTRTNWQKSSPSAYKSAWLNGWLNECCTHMAKRKSKN